jgi:hypothetical protein
MQKLKSKLQNILLIRRTNQPLPFCEGEIEREFSTRQSLSKGKIPLLFSLYEGRRLNFFDFSGWRQDCHHPDLINLLRKNYWAMETRL